MAISAEFRTLGISQNVLAALEAKGFETPSSIQQSAIPILLEGKKDVVAQAQTGTGKTAAFGIPIIDILGNHERGVRALVLTPTRELALQVCTEMNSLQSNNDLEFLAVFGGQSIDLQLSKLRRGMDVVVGTPGRVMDLMRRGALSLSTLEFVVLDEADEMLDMGFVDDIRSILAETNPDKRTLMFSATMPTEIMAIAKEFMREFELIRCTPEQPSVQLTEQICYNIHRDQKLDALMRIIDFQSNFYGMVFCRTRDDVDELSQELSKRGYRAESLHGDIAQAQRTKTIERFRQKQFDMLIATDVAARGIDVADLTHVVNFSIPQTTEAYIHRIGRTGRAGKEGVAITFVTPAEQRKLAIIMRDAKCNIRKMTLPGAYEIVKGKTAAFKREVAANLTDNSYEALAAELLKESSPLELISSLLKIHCKEDLLESSYSDLGSPMTRGARVPAGDRKRLFVGLGKMDRMGAKAILDIIFEATGIGCQKLGKVDCYDRFSFIDASDVDADKIVKAFRNEKRNGKQLITIARDKDGDVAAEQSSSSPAERPAFRPRSSAAYTAAPRAPRNPVPAAACDDARLNRKQRRALQFSDKKVAYGID